MLFVDYRDGSNSLVAPLKKMGLPVEEADLAVGEGGPVADLAFTGKGPGGTSVEIGVEYKKLSELVTSLRTERLQGSQLLSMRQHYDFCWLLYEGELFYDRTGRLLRRSGRRTFVPIAGGMSQGELHKRVLGLHLRGGLNPWHTRTHTDSLRWIEALYRTWTDEDYDDHRSHIGIYQPPTPEPVSDFRQVAIKHFPGIGYHASGAVEAHFGGSLKRAWNASLKEWASILIPDKQGRVKRLGETRAERILHFLEGRK